MPQVMLDVGVLTVKDLCLKFNDDEPHCIVIGPHYIVHNLQIFWWKAFIMG